MRRGDWKCVSGKKKKKKEKEDEEEEEEEERKREGFRLCNEHH